MRRKRRSQDTPSHQDLQRAYEKILAYGPHPEDLVELIGFRIEPYDEQAWELLKSMDDVDEHLCDALRNYRRGEEAILVDIARTILAREPSDERLYVVVRNMCSLYPTQAVVKEEAWTLLKSRGVNNTTLRDMVKFDVHEYSAEAAVVLIAQDPSKDDLLVIIRKFNHTDWKQELSLPAARLVMSRDDELTWDELHSIFLAHAGLEEEIGKRLLLLDPEVCHSLHGDIELEDMTRRMPEWLARRLRLRFYPPMSVVEKRREEILQVFGQVRAALDREQPPILIEDD